MDHGGSGEVSHPRPVEDSVLPSSEYWYETKANSGLSCLSYILDFMNVILLPAMERGKYYSRKFNYLFLDF